MNKKYIVRLTPDERAYLQGLLKENKKAVRALTHARILLKADVSEDGPGWPDHQISEAFDISKRTVERVRERFVEEGLESSLYHRRGKRQYLSKIDGEFEARLIAMTCSEPPAGHGRWTLRLLADRFVALGYVDSISHESIRQTLKKMNLNLG